MCISCNNSFKGTQLKKHILIEYKFQLLCLAKYYKKKYVRTYINVYLSIIYVCNANCFKYIRYAYNLEQN